MELRTQIVGCLHQLIMELAHSFDGFIAHQASNGQRKARQYFTVRCCNHATLHFSNCMGGQQHGVIVHASHYQVVMVVGHCRGNRATLQAQALE